MADSSIGPTCVRPNPKTSRRTVLAGMALAPAAALPAFAMPTGSDTRDFHECVKAYREAEKVSRAAHARYEQAQEKLAANTLPYPLVDFDGEMMDRRAFGLMYRGLNAVEEIQPGRIRRETIAALRKGQAQLRRVDLENMRLRRRMGLPALNAASLVASKESSRLFCSALSFPVTSAAALLAKIEFLEDEDILYECGEEIAADVRRIAENGRLIGGAA